MRRRASHTGGHGPAYWRFNFKKGPAFFVAEPLILEDEVADLVGKLRALPLALCTLGFAAIVRSRRCTGGPDGIRRCAELMVCHMGHRCRVTGRASRFLGGTGRISGRAMGADCCGASLSHGDLATRPGTCLLDRSTRTVVS
jgi:hypothetical protein